MRQIPIGLTEINLNAQQIKNIAQGMRFMAGECFSEVDGIEFIQSAIFLESMTWNFYRDCRGVDKVTVKNHFIIERYFEDDNQMMFDITFISLEGFDAFNHIIRSYNLANGVSND